MYIFRLLKSGMAEHTNNQKARIESVYHSVEDILRVLEKPEFYGLAEVQQLISIFYSEREKCKKLSESAAMETSKKFPFIVLEGLDGAGKTTVTKKLSATLSAVCRGTPPQSLLHLRTHFDSHPIHLRRAYYSLGNYIAAAEVKVLRCQQPVIMDRFWHSTAAYTIASEVRDGWGNSQLPPAGDPVYNWPTDLLKPDVVLFLYVSEEIRNMRLSRRIASTLEEDKLKEDKIFRENLLEAYKRMRRPAMVSINSNKTIKHVLAEINPIIGDLIVTGSRMLH